VFTIFSDVISDIGFPTKTRPATEWFCLNKCKKPK
jgi:hypothetical protein